MSLGDGSGWVRERFRVESAWEQVASEVRRVLGTCTGPVRLPSEERLALQFGVSRGTMRKALARLRADGLIHVVVGDGTYGIPPDAPPGQDVAAIRRLGAIIRLRRALELAAVVDMARMRSLPISAAGDLHDLMRPDRDDFASHRMFHELLMGACATRWADPVPTSIFDWISHNVDRSRLPEGALGPVPNEHAAIVEAVRAGDVLAAEQHMARHLDRMAAAYRTCL